MPVLTSERHVTAWAMRLSQSTAPVFFDTETTGLNPRVNKLVAVQTYQEGEGSAIILDARHLPTTFLHDMLRLALDGKLIVGHNLKFDLGVLLALGVELKGATYFDTMLARQVYAGMGGSEARMNGISFSLAETAKLYAKVDMSKEARNWFIDLDKRPDDWKAPFPAEEVTYMGLDVTVLPAIYTSLQQHLAANGLEKTARLEMRVLPAMAALEAQGVHIDVDGWRAFIQEKQQEADRLEGEALAHFAYPILSSRAKTYDSANSTLQEWKQALEAVERTAKAQWGGEGSWADAKRAALGQWKETHQRPTTPKQDTSLPNLNSPSQLMDGFKEMGLDVEGTGTRALADYASHPAVAALIAYRKAAKFVQAFGETLLAKVEADGRIHPDYRQIGASTGRMSCTNPNWQQVPSKGDGKRLRRLVTAPKGHKLVCADFSNIELRILASLSGDTHLTGLFSQGLDLHSELAYSTFSLDRDVDVKATEFVPGWSYREVMKMVNYGLVYGMSAMRLAATIHVSKGRAQEIMDAYFAVLPGVRKWLDTQKKAALSDDKYYSRTAGGRIRRYPSLKGLDDDTVRFLKGRMARQAMNTPIQGLSADVTKLAVATWWEADEARKGKLVAVVHDELVVEAPAGDAAIAKRVLEKAMNMAQRTLVKLPAEALPRPVAVVDEYWRH